ncbi:PREDICTED: RNA-binding protein 7 isoform X1 [Camelina sativa]|uniref:RNA-binding protein 7 isoform X1 n=1 Tax=Camelina sativa TaxID=90675 RepID=A0ABM0VFJ2_CAMSA|nr:PREDICTED: RNA-binding protein 7 isoform X1 [Camelina sativa]
MSGGNSNCTVYIGNVDERVSDRVLYDIMIQAGRVIDLHIPRDKETDKPKGFAFAEFETEEIADYAVKLFSGLVSLYSRTLKFAISGQDKLQVNSGNRMRPQPLAFEYSDRAAYHSERFSSQLISPPSPLPLDYTQEPPPPGVSNGASLEYSRRVLGSALDSINHSRPRRY